jgi:hypothetical protein
VLAREGALALVDPAVLPPLARGLIRIGRLIERREAGTSATRLAAALTRLGPSYVKFGQFLATRPDVVGMKIASDLSALQDRMPPFPMAQARAIVEAAHGRPVEQVFASFGEPVAAASIAQVHRARLNDGREVAVKILRPGIRDRFQRDLGAMRFGAELAERRSAEARRLRMTGVVETLARSVTMEMDLRLEAAALVAFATASGARALRGAPGRVLLAIGVADAKALRARAAEFGFITEPDDPRRRVAACTGAPGCASALFDTRALAMDLAPLVPRGAFVHLSGCAKGCAHPRPAALTLVGTPDGLGLIRRGRAGDTIAAQFPPGEARAVLAREFAFDA